MHLRGSNRRLRRGAALPFVAFALVVGGAAQAAHGAARPVGGAGRASLHDAGRSASFKLDVSPYPATPDASPQTQIDFFKLGSWRIGSLTVTGSRSGAHAGRLSSLQSSDGVAFIAVRPFANGERVNVSVKFLRRDGASKRIRFGFTVAAPVRVAEGASTAGEDGPALVHSTIHAGSFVQSFHSESWLHPPVVTVGKDSDTSSGDILTDAHRSIQAGPLILNAQGQPLWFDPLPNGEAGFNLQVQQYAGQSVLTYWQGYVSGGVGSGEDVILDHAYQPLAVVQAADGYHADLHEFQITPQGDAFITAYAPVQADLSSVGGPQSGTLLDSIIEEINIRTGQLLWEWHAYGHVHLAESYAGKPNGNPYDFFHVNSIQQLAGGDVLVSARHTFAVYDINQATGKILWVLGGKHSTFKIGRGANFSWQHDAHMLPNGDITLFDDGAGYKRTEKESRGLELHLNMRSKQATLVHQYAHVPPVSSNGEGSMQTLSNGNVFVGFGSNPYFAEFTQSGRQVFSGSFHYPVEFYRAFRAQWVGQPIGSPFAAASPTGSGTTVYASWNGATEIAAWRVYAGAAPTALTYVAQQPFRGFETAISTPSAGPYFSVQAINAQGRVLGASAPVVR